jgi:diguanylate cyclase
VCGRRSRERAASVRNGLRVGDRPFRWGGDEFMVLMADTAPETARAAVQRVAARAATDGAGASFSFGVAALADGSDAQELKARADRDLLACKSRQRSAR